MPGNWLFIRDENDFYRNWTTRTDIVLLLGFFSNLIAVMELFGRGESTGTFNLRAETKRVSGLFTNYSEVNELLWMIGQTGVDLLLATHTQREIDNPAVKTHANRLLDERRAKRQATYRQDR